MQSLFTARTRAQQGRSHLAPLVKDSAVSDGRLSHLLQTQSDQTNRTPLIAQNLSSQYDGQAHTRKYTSRPTHLADSADGTFHSNSPS